MEDKDLNRDIKQEIEELADNIQIILGDLSSEIKKIDLESEFRDNSEDIIKYLKKANSWLSMIHTFAGLGLAKVAVRAAVKKTNEAIESSKKNPGKNSSVVKEAIKLAVEKLLDKIYS